MTSSHLSFVTCHVSLVTCRLSIVTKDWDSTGLSSKSKHSRKFDDNSISEQVPNLDAWIAGRGWFVDQLNHSFCCLHLCRLNVYHFVVWQWLRSRLLYKTCKGHGDSFDGWMTTAISTFLAMQLFMFNITWVLFLGTLIACSPQAKKKLNCGVWVMRRVENIDPVAAVTMITDMAMWQVNLLWYVKYLSCKLYIISFCWMWSQACQKLSLWLLRNLVHPGAWSILKCTDMCHVTSVNPGHVRAPFWYILHQTNWR